MLPSINWRIVAKAREGVHNKTLGYARILGGFANVSEG
jgi:hypothetical protein